MRKGVWRVLGLLLVTNGALWAAEAARPQAGNLSAAIAQLGAKEFSAREAATQRLIASGMRALPVLKAAFPKTDDLEVRARITRIRKTILAKHPEKVLKITLEPPARPVVLGRDSAIAFKVWFENVSGMVIVVGKPVDGSLTKNRDPQYRFTIMDAAGKKIPRAVLKGCGNVNPLKVSDFVRLKPGQRVNLFRLPGQGSWGPYLHWYPALKPGLYTFRLTYTISDRNRTGGQPLRADERGVAALQHEAFKCTLSSAPVKVRFVAAPKKAAAGP